MSCASWTLSSVRTPTMTGRTASPIAVIGVSQGSVSVKGRASGRPAGTRWSWPTTTRHSSSPHWYLWLQVCRLTRSACVTSATNAWLMMTSSVPPWMRTDPLTVSPG